MKILSTLALLATVVLATAAYAQDYVLTLKNHQFVPKELAIPAGQKVKLTVKNEDSTPAEFESHDFNREKVIKGNSETSVFVGPLDAGTYHFYDEFNEDTANGKLIVK